MLPQNEGVCNAPTPIFFAGRRIGFVAEGTFHKQIQGSKHLLRTPRAICFDVSTLRDAVAAGATRVEVTDTETQTTYSTTFDRLRERCFPVQRGFGNQVGMTLEHWSINGELPRADQKATISNKARQSLQMDLFGGAK